MTAAAGEAILVSRFPDAVTPGALPLLPNVVSIHPHRLNTGMWIVFRWFDDGHVLHQAPPEFCDTLEQARALVPSVSYAQTPCPDDFAHEMYVLPKQRE